MCNFLRNVRKWEPQAQYQHQYLASTPELASPESASASLPASLASVSSALVPASSVSVLAGVYTIEEGSET